MFATGLQRHWVIRWTYPSFAALFLAVSAVGLALQPRLRTFETIAGALLVGLIAPPIQSMFNSVKQVIGDVPGYGWDSRFAQLDRWLHFGRHPWQWLEPLVHHRGVVRFIDLAYILWFPVLFGFIVWLAWATNRALRQKALVATLLVWSAAATSLHCFLRALGRVITRPSSQARILTRHSWPPCKPVILRTSSSLGSTRQVSGSLLVAIFRRIDRIGTPSS